jgi:23S rRNA (cytosine1962-C5)-methyltransferase
MAVQEVKFEMFHNRLVKVCRHLGKQAKRLNVSCWRLYDHDLPEFPFCVELYGDNLYVAEYKRRHGMSEEEHDEWMEKCIEVMMAVLKIEKDKIYLKMRQRKTGRLGQYQRLDSLKNEMVVEENGLKFYVNLSDYLDTGLFLDHRLTRQIVKEKADKRKVLNLFAYTGSFSVYAAAGHAAEIITVDLSNTYLGWAERNMELNGFTDDRKYKYVHADVKQYLKTVPADHFDIVILDPPTFSNSKRMKDDFLDIQRDHLELINDCLTAMRKEAVLYFSTNYRKFELNKDKIKDASIKDITKATTAFDFEGRLGRACFEITKQD